MKQPSQKDFWDKLQVMATLSASLLIPLAVAFVGNTYSSAIKESENRLRYVELALSILRADPKPETEALREWAIELLNHQSVVPLSRDAQAQLRTHKVQIRLGSGGAGGDGGGDGGGGAGRSGGTGDSGTSVGSHGASAVTSK